MSSAVVHALGVSLAFPFFVVFYASFFVRCPGERLGSCEGGPSGFSLIFPQIPGLGATPPFRYTLLLSFFFVEYETTTFVGLFPSADALIVPPQSARRCRSPTKRVIVRPASLFQVSPVLPLSKFRPLGFAHLSDLPSFSFFCVHGILTLL